MSLRDNLRLLHLADLHLGARCAFLKDKASERTKDFERAFERAMGFARDAENGINLVIIAGDLFDSHRPEPRLVDLVRREFAAVRDTGVHIAVVPGTHDTCSYRNSVYRTEDLGDIVLLIDGSECPVTLELAGHPVHIYGIARSLDHQDVALDKLSRIDASGVHIGILHAAIQPTSGINFSDTELTVTLPALAGTGLDYVALGHYHNFGQYSANGVTIVHPGTLEGRSFRETGERYLVTVDFTPGGLVVEKYRFNARTIGEETIDLNVTPCGDQRELCEKIASMADRDTILRLVVQGDAEWYLDAAAVEALLSDRFFYLEVIDDTRVYSARWVEQFQREPTVRGIFVRKMLDKLEKARTDEEKRVLDTALKYGLMELAGEDAD